MIKQTITMMAVICILFVAWLPCQGEDNLIYGCYQKNHGQLRIVSNHSECLPSELPISWNQLCGSCNGGSPGKLACVTGALNKESTVTGDAFITNQKNIEISHWSEVFTIFYAPDSGGSGDWGLICKEDWINTGCSQQTSGTVGEHPDNFDVDIRQFNNGCFSDSRNEFNYLTIFTTCCKIM
jgi:hypothetical protein